MSFKLAGALYSQPQKPMCHKHQWSLNHWRVARTLIVCLLPPLQTMGMRIIICSIVFFLNGGEWCSAVKKMFVQCERYGRLVTPAYARTSSLCTSVNHWCWTKGEGRPLFFDLGLKNIEGRFTLLEKIMSLNNLNVPSQKFVALPKDKMSVSFECFSCRDLERWSFFMTKRLFAQKEDCLLAPNDCFGVDFRGFVNLRVSCRRERQAKKISY